MSNKDLILTLHTKGLVLQEIGDRVGVSRERVRQVLVKHGITQRNGPHKTHKNIDAIIRLAKEDKNNGQIADALGLSYSHVSHVRTVNGCSWKKKAMAENKARWRTIYEWYMEKPERSLKQTAKQFNRNSWTTVTGAFIRYGWPRKERHGAAHKASIAKRKAKRKALACEMEGNEKVAK